MLNALLPATTNLSYRGSRVALWLFGGVILIKAGTAAAAIFNGDHAASIADGIPIASYTPQGARTVVALFGALGVTQFLVSLAGGVVLWRYRPLVAAFSALLAVEFLGRQVVAIVHPIERPTANAGAIINWAIFVALLLAVILAWPRRAEATARLERS